MGCELQNLAGVQVPGSPGKVQSSTAALNPAWQESMLQAVHGLEQPAN
jgi:hypothetical protein